MFVKSISVLLVLVLSSFIHVSGQVEILEKSYKIAKKDRKGALIEVATNEETKILSMVYARSSGLNKIKFDAYKYDVDLNFLGVEEEVDKLKWGISFGFDKEEWTTTKFLDRFGPTGQVTFIKKVVDHKWNIVTGHSKKVVSSEKIKPKNDVGDKYFHKGSYVVEEDNSILVFTGIHIKKTLNQMQDFHIMHCDGEMNITLPDSYKSKYLMNKVYDGIIVDDNISVSNDEKARDWTVVLAPLKGSGPYEASTNPNLNLYRYLRISPKGKILENIEFESPCNGWRIDGVYEKNGSVYFYGQGLMKDVGKTDWAGAMHIKGAHAGSYDTHEYTHFQYVKFTGGKLEFSSAVSAADIDAKKIKPAGQSDFITYDAEQFKTLNFMVTDANEVLITCQDQSKLKFKGLLVFHYDAKGSLVSNYGAYNPKSKNKPATIGSKTLILPSPNGNVMNLVALQPRKQDKTTSAVSYSYDLTSFNLSEKTMMDTKQFGEFEKKDYYLLLTNTFSIGNYLFFISSDEKYKTIMLSRLDLSK